VRLAFTIPGRPVPKERPRFARGHAYTSKRTRDYERLVRTTAAAALPADWPLDADYTVELTVFHETRVHGDVDNYGKSVCDALNELAWTDDRQVSRLVVSREYDRTNTRIEVAIQVRR